NPAQTRGVNSVGLRRAGFPAEDRAEIKRFYKLLYRSNLNLSQAIEAMKAEVQTDSGREIVAFLEAESQLGVLLK
ncbi:MAG: acyl-ACP--UDP-N-acetylglucosamine O-acyltransferase, partial [Vulcanimicrobiaceae bacterium]